MGVGLEVLGRIVLDGERESSHVCYFDQEVEVIILVVSHALAKHFGYEFKNGNRINLPYIFSDPLV